MIKAVFIDIDETLTNSQREVTEKPKSEIANCVNGSFCYAYLWRCCDSV